MRLSLLLEEKVAEQSEVGCGGLRSSSYFDGCYASYTTSVKTGSYKPLLPASPRGEAFCFSAVGRFVNRPYRFIENIYKKHNKKSEKCLLFLDVRGILYAHYYAI